MQGPKDTGEDGFSSPGPGGSFLPSTLAVQGSEATAGVGLLSFILSGLPNSGASCKTHDTS